MQTFLVATEGSSDTNILRHAFAMLRPEIGDFFRFIDVSERHPFPGTGNLLKFAEGLVKIDVHNQLVFLFDNDAEGFDAYQRLSALSLPQNMRDDSARTGRSARSFRSVVNGSTTRDLQRTSRRLSGPEFLIDQSLPAARAPSSGSRHRRVF